MTVVKDLGGGSSSYTILSKKNKGELGIYKFINLSKKTKKKIICLGGINKDNIKN